MTDKEIELEVRRWLEHTIKIGAYDVGVMLALKGLYYRGREEVQQEIKNALNIDND